MRSTIVGLAFILILGLFGYYALGTFRARQASVCAVCSRPLHSASSVMAEIDGERKRFCCAACAIWAERQTGAIVKITQVSDHDSGSAIDPSEATFVVGSRVNHCLQQHSVFDLPRTTIDPAKETGALQFDRCSPSVLAFLTRSAATRFVGQEGGQLADIDGLRQLLP